MNNKFQRTELIISLSEFLNRARKVKSFTSSTGKRYKITKFKNKEMYFIRLDAKSNKEWNMSLEEIYKAYQELDNFATLNFKPYVPITHSPARGLLLHLGLIE